MKCMPVPSVKQDSIKLHDHAVISCHQRVLLKISLLAVTSSGSAEFMAVSSLFRFGLLGKVRLQVSHRLQTVFGADVHVLKAQALLSWFPVMNHLSQRG